ncbi:hypothetical protein JYU34_020175 [Plutella xylostella]|uniref:Uncharacterized protein n=1 Tax=Plutella xylostella TaxID=51655 RepID=A0ABQ7PTZ5_PLUXY|nr:hypothetical protein JYU34_020175 [Plutella xylostella]
MEVLVLLPWLFVIVTAQDTLYSVDQLLQRGISSGDGVSTYAVDGDDGAIQSNEGLNANLEEQQQKKLQNLGTMFLRDTLYSVDQLLQRGISSGDGVSTYAVDDDDGAIQSNEGLNANLEEQQQKKLQNLGTMFLRMAQAAGLRENKIKRPPYPPTNPHGGPVQMYTVSGGPLLPGQLIVSDFDTRRGEEVDVDTRSGGEVDFDPRRTIIDASDPTEKPKRRPYMKLKLQGYVYRMQ